MKRKLVLIALIVLSLVNITVFAAHADAILPYASRYLDYYSVELDAKNDETMRISVLVQGTSEQDKIGVSYIDIEEKIGNRWSYLDTLYAADNPHFYNYDSYDYVSDIDFEGTPGVEYRVTVCVYAEKDGGSDSKTITSGSCVCR